MYKCIKEFKLEKCNDDGRSIDGKYITVKLNSKWIIDDNEYNNLIGGEIRLIKSSKAKSYTWIEISEDTFKNNFIKE